MNESLFSKSKTMQTSAAYVRKLSVCKDNESLGRKKQTYLNFRNSLKFFQKIS